MPLSITSGGKINIIGEQILDFGPKFQTFPSLKILNSPSSTTYIAVVSSSRPMNFGLRGTPSTDSNIALALLKAILPMICYLSEILFLF